MGNEIEEYVGSEYFKRFGKDCCSGCGSHEVRTYQREKAGNIYIVYVCENCHSVIKREFR